MKPIQGLEFALRLQGGPLTAEAITARIADIVNEPDVDAERVMNDARTRPDLFHIDEAGLIHLTDRRKEDRITYFRENVQDMRRVLRLMPFTSSVWTEIALIYLVATLEKGTLPIINTEEGSLWAALDPLAEEYPQIKSEVQLLLGGGVMVTGQLQSALWRMASVRLSPAEFVNEMRNVVLADARSGQFCLPWSVAELMARLLGDDVKEVFDPAADASVIPAVLALNGSARADAVFINHFAQFFNTLQARVLGANMNARLNENPWPDSGRHYAHCISAPPFGGRVKEEGSLRAIEPYEIAINKIIKHLAPGGRAVVLVPENMLFSQGRSFLRKELVEQGLLQAVVSMPPGTFAPYTAIKSSIIVLERSTSTKHDVLFVDASSYTTTHPRAEAQVDAAGVLDALLGRPNTDVARIMHVDELRSHGYDLNSARYLFRPEEALIGRVALGIHVKPLRLEPSRPSTTAPFARISDLKENAMEHTLQVDKVEMREVPRHSKRLERSALLIALRWSNLKPTWFEYAGVPIAVSTDILALAVDQTEVYVPYLVHELLSPKVQAQVDRFVIGSVIPRLRPRDVLDLLIELPPKAEQEAKVRGLREAHVEALRRKAEEEAQRHGIQLQQFGNAVSFKHRLGTPLLSVGSGIDTVRMGLDAIQPNWRDHLISVREQLTLGDIMDNVAYELQRISAMLDADSLELDVTKFPLGTMDLVSYAKKAVRRAQTELNGGHEVSFFVSADIKEQLKGKAPMLGNAALLDIAMDALVDNARRHGFANEQGPHRLDFSVGMRIEDKKNWLVLSVANSGRPFPEGFGLERYVRKGVYAGSTGHTGIGGYHVNEIVQHHKGRMDLLTAPKLLGRSASEIDLYFPLAH